MQTKSEPVLPKFQPQALNLTDSENQDHTMSTEHSDAILMTVTS